MKQTWDQDTYFREGQGHVPPLADDNAAFTGNNAVDAAPSNVATMQYEDFQMPEGGILMRNLNTRLQSLIPP